MDHLEFDGFGVLFVYLLYLTAVRSGEIFQGSRKVFLMEKHQNYAIKTIIKTFCGLELGIRDFPWTTRVI